MKLYVVDTSVVAKLFLLEEGREHVLDLFRAAMKQEIRLIAPTLLLYELNNTLICEGFAESEVLECLTTLDIQIQQRVLTIYPPTIAMFRKIVEIASLDTKGQGYISAYDATFHALALLEDGIFLTADKTHYRKTVDLIGSVTLLENLKS
jgi:predicted nucleic acid-binding protein